jgi:hypothetical protein
MKLKLQHVGPITEAQLAFGDLTVLVGPQASGKSIALQMLKLMVDTGQVQEKLTKHGMDWRGDLSAFFEVYFGEGMKSIWGEHSAVFWNGKPIDMPRRLRRKQRNQEESLFFVPAQRVLTLRGGWPLPFTDYSPGDPFAVRQFSEHLRILMEREFRVENVGSNPQRIFPAEGWLNSDLQNLVGEHVFRGFGLRVDTLRFQKRLVLARDGGSLPFMVWSAGQREFVPLLLGMYWLMPGGKASRREAIEWVVLEELEMGLHPRAISVVLLMVLELVARGYRVCISTHSPQVLEAMWALRHLRENRASPRALLTMFEAPSTPPMQKLAQTVMNKTVKVYYFDAATGKTRDISSLDPTDEESGEGGWGGLTEFSGRANAVVADAVANANGEGQS